jgi:hypothetical protein
MRAHRSIAASRLRGACAKLERTERLPALAAEVEALEARPSAPLDRRGTGDRMGTGDAGRGEDAM